MGGGLFIIISERLQRLLPEILFLSLLLFRKHPSPTDISHFEVSMKSLSLLLSMMNLCL